MSASRKTISKSCLELGSRPPLRGVSRALRARNPQRVSERVSRGLLAPGSKKCPRQSRKSLRSLKKDCFETPETLLRLFRTLFGPWGRKAPGDSFGDSLGIPGPKGPGESSKGRAGSQALSISDLILVLGIARHERWKTRNALYNKCFPDFRLSDSCAGALPARKVPRVSCTKYSCDLLKLSLLNL